MGNFSSGGDTAGTQPIATGKVRWSEEEWNIASLDATVRCLKIIKSSNWVACHRETNEY